MPRLRRSPLDATDWSTTATVQSISGMKDDELLRLAGIEDVAGFYRDRFLTGGVS